MEESLKYIIPAGILFCTVILGIWSKISFAKKTDIYHQNGSTKFPTLGFCDKNHKAICQALNEIKTTIKEADQKREMSKGEISSSITNLTHEVGVLQGKVEALLTQNIGGG